MQLLLLLLSGIAFASPETDYLYPAGATLSRSVSAWYDAGDNAYFLRFVGDETIEYKIDLDDSGVQGGYLRIYETTTASYPIYTGGFNYNNSGGGTMTVFTSAVDNRITAAAPACFFSTFADSIMDLWHCPCNFVPGLQAVAEMADLGGLFAPKPMLIIAGTTDPLFPID